MDNIEAFVRAIRKVNPNTVFVPMGAVQQTYMELQEGNHETDKAH